MILPFCLGVPAGMEQSTASLGGFVKNRWEVWEEIPLFECTELNFFFFYCIVFIAMMENVLLITY